MKSLISTSQLQMNLHTPLQTSRTPSMPLRATSSSPPLWTSPSPGPSSQPGLLCDQCSFMAKTASDMRKHVKDHNPSGYDCSQCDFKTKNINLLIRHVKHQHTCRDRFLCDECDFTTNKNLKLVTHKERTHLNLSFTCEICRFPVENPYPILPNMSTFSLVL